MADLKHSAAAKQHKQRMSNHWHYSKAQTGMVVAFPLAWIVLCVKGRPVVDKWNNQPCIVVILRVTMIL